MIKVKTFFINTPNPLHHHKLDDAINLFIAQNEVEVVDIKYSVAATGGDHGTFVYPSAMLIYNTKE